ncbi:MAG TPA: hypothetical protein VG820_08170 [Fimbriimonadaceae bacterium]|nr:hypothetical protein [Fimbriimonadaceae bacterium]
MEFLLEWVEEGSQPYCALLGEYGMGKTTTCKALAKELLRRRAEDKSADRFRFAHASLLEYFLAGYLRRALVEGRPEAWQLPRASRETLDFLGQWLLDERQVALSGGWREILGCDAEAWRHLNWIVRDEKGWPMAVPGETYGALPVRG